MEVSILTLSPNFFQSLFSEGLIKRAIDKNLLKINLINIREFAKDKHKTCDDKPYGGGAGMILRIDVLVPAIEFAVNMTPKAKAKKVILLSPQGRVLTNQKAKELSSLDHLILICGKYEGVDARIENFIDEELSIGDYILSGGEIAAGVVIDALTRFIPGVIPKKESIETDTFSKGLLKYRQYTRPKEFRGLKVPNVLLSGNHAEIKKFREEDAKTVTATKRPDLLSSYKVRL